MCLLEGILVISIFYWYTFWSRPSTSIIKERNKYINYDNKGVSLISHSWLSCRSSMLVEYVGFVEGGKPKNPAKNHRSKARNSENLTSRMAPGQNTIRTTLVGGELSPQHPPCSLYSHTQQVRFNTDTKLKAFRETSFRFQNVLKRKRRLLDISCHYCTTKLSLL